MGDSSIASSKETALENFQSIDSGESAAVATTAVTDEQSEGEEPTFETRRESVAICFFKKERPCRTRTAKSFKPLTDFLKRRIPERETKFWSGPGIR